VNTWGMKILLVHLITALFIFSASCTGDSGAQRSAGPQGELGPQGEHGPSGHRGSPGQQGAQGIQGPAGKLPSEAELLVLINNAIAGRSQTPDINANAGGAQTPSSKGKTVPVKANNVLFFVVDDLGWGDVGYHGSKISTPNIDNIVAGGIELNRVYTFPVCELTRAGLLTGRSPLTIGVKNEHFYGTTGGLPLDEHLISQDFQAANYSTFMLGKWHLGGSVDTEFLPQNRGFDHFYGLVGGAIDSDSHKVPSPKGNKPTDWQRNGVQVNEVGHATDLIAQEAVTLLKSIKQDQPFFMYVAFNAVHTPLRAPSDLVDKYQFFENPDRQIYAAMVEQVDRAMGTVLDTLKEQSLSENTLVVFLSDNGGNEDKGGALNNPLRGGKAEVYEGGIRTTGALYWPNTINPGVKSDQFLSVMDLYSTILSATGITPNNLKPLDGTDYWSNLTHSIITPPSKLVIGFGKSFAVFDQQWKLIRNRESDEDLLFDIIKDPNETENLASLFPGIATELAKEISGLTR
jgi:arylsulfatase B